LKGVGLSTRKAEYIVDLSQHFASGRISTHALTAADDEELAQMLISVRGIGRWTGTFIVTANTLSESSIIRQNRKN
jgi:DNA-3-methyladenine glycosylase II